MFVYSRNELIELLINYLQARGVRLHRQLRDRAQSELVIFKAVLGASVGLLIVYVSTVRSAAPFREPFLEGDTIHLELLAHCVVNEVNALNEGEGHVLLANVFLEQLDLVLVHAHRLGQLPASIAKGLDYMQNQV